ncbi:hypothetical protein KAS08_05575 [Candidatus Pacearchaeota archaeon]|nr:hypothetical protein [Candidatus Pacearchaeota archaeon]
MNKIMANKKIILVALMLSVSVILVGALVSAEKNWAFENYTVNISHDLNVVGNLTLGEKITFSFGEIIDNIKNGWIKITGGLEVNGSVNITGTGNALYFPDGTNMTSASSGSDEAYVTYEEYDTGWLYKTSVWTNVHLGTDNSSTTGNVTHNLNAPLSDLDVHVLISIDGTDANSWELSSETSATSDFGLRISYASNNEVEVQTGASGIRMMDDTGSGSALDGEDWYYKIVVTKLTKSDNATNIIEEVGDDIYLKNVSKNFGIGTTSPTEKLHVEGNVNITGNLTLGAGKIYMDGGDMIFRV